MIDLKRVKVKVHPCSISTNDSSNPILKELYQSQSNTRVL